MISLLAANPGLIKRIAYGLPSPTTCRAMSKSRVHAGMTSKLKKICKSKSKHDIQKKAQINNKNEQTRNICYDWW